ncbi:MAG TPA: hypothetical protein VHL08_09065 [Dongiaceae bacterium]|jgi:hypothetical protein|nr:hypothetical protein [Dongiaceae bacterium]
MADWDDLAHELEQWNGAPFTFWWRDDDCVAATPALARLLAYGAPVALAIIPARLAGGLSLPQHATALQHGFDHRNRAGPGEKKSEFPPQRPAEEVGHDLARGFALLQGRFPGQFRPVFVPPWNRYEHAYPWRKAGCTWISQYRDWSVFNGSEAGEPHRLPTHVDLIDWRTRAFAGEARTLDRILAHLHARRSGRAPRDQPTGLLTHHLVHDRECWAFLDKWCHLLNDRAKEMKWVSVA